MFTADEISRKVRQQPFRPFRIVTSSGQMFDVRHPELILVGRRDVTVGAPSTEDPRHYDQISEIAIMHITALQNLPVPATHGGNGEG
jgi:hypothetical protein